MIVAAIYILLFSFVIYRSRFFDTSVFNFKRVKALHFVFLLKIAFGFFLTWIYTHYYTDRQSADIFKYYDDAKIMYSAFENVQYGDYFRMLFGFSNDNSYFDSTYYAKMNHWYRMYDFGTYNDNHTIIRFNALMMLFSFGSFHAHTVFMCFISLCGLTALHRAFVRFLPLKNNILFLAIFLLPSVLFWGSGVLKEGILLFAIGFLCYSFFRIFLDRKKILLNVFVLLLTLFLLSINKQYLLAAIVPALCCFLIADRFQVRRPFLIYFSLYVAGFLAVYAISLFSTHTLAETLALKQRDFIALAKGGVFLQNNYQFVRIDPDKKKYLDTLADKTFKIKNGSSYMYWKNEDLEDTIFVSSSTDSTTYKLVWDLPKAGSAIEVSPLKPTFLSMIANAPNALYLSVCKPGLFSAKSMLERISAMENACIILFLLVCCIFTTAEMNKNLFWLCFFISISILLLVGYTSPIAGAIVRYKVPVLPFMLLCGIIAFDRKRLKIFSDKTAT